MHNDPLEGEEKDFASAVSTEAAAAAESFATVYFLNYSSLMKDHRPLPGFR